MVWRHLRGGRRVVPRESLLMARVAVLTVSDGRASVHSQIATFASDVEQRIATALIEAGHDVLRARSIVTSNEAAVSEARLLADQRPDLTIVSIPVWAFPHFTMLVSHETPGPLLLFSNLDPAYPGMVGMLAAGGGLDQVGRIHGRAWGDIAEPEVFARIDSHVRAGAAVNALHGSTFGRIGGRPMGMYTAVANPDQWMAQFGVDVEEIDQWELVRRAPQIDGDRVVNARRWIETHAAGVHYDGARLTPDLLERQIRSYYVMRDLIDEWNLDFCGIKGQPELTNNFCTMDVTEAFLNDPYDWDGPKQPIVCSTEADMDGALTMQVLKRLSGTPVLFADMRHYDRGLGVWDLVNSGQHPTWFAARSDDPAENLRHVHFFPQEFYFPAGGASVQHLAAPGDFTFARLTRREGTYRMHVLRGSLEQFDDATNERVMRASTYVWPHAFARLDAEIDDVLDRYASNHIHAIPGDHVASLKIVCRLAGVEFDGFGAVG